MLTLIRCLHLAHFMQSIAMPETYCTSTNFFPQTGHSTIRVRISEFESSVLVDIFSIHFVLAANIIDIFYKYNKYNRFYLLYLRCNRKEFQESQQGQLIGCRYWLFSFIKYMREYEVGIKTANGEPVYSYEYIETLRAADRKKSNPLKVIPQKGSQERFVGSNADLTFIGGNRGGGKCLYINELVCTPFGFRRIGDLEPGDIIVGLNGGMQKVVYCSHNGIKDLYRMEFIDGSSVLCSEDHLWNIKKTNYAHKRRRLYGLGKEDDWRVWTTAMILEHLKKQEGKKYPSHIMIPLCEPVRFTQGIGKRFKPSIDPYVIGALLGDGTITKNQISGNVCLFESMDDEIVSEFEKAGIDMSHFYESNLKKSRSYIINNKRLLEELKGLKIAGCRSENKFIPRYYKYATIEERFSLIQGLMDTDGYIDSRGHCSYTTVSKQLADDVKFIINSLGGIATVTKSKSGYKKPGGEYVECLDSYDVYIRIKESSRLFRLPRKKDRSKEYNGGISIYGRRIIGCKYEGKGEVCCIAVTNPDSLYLTNDFIVTHNSFAMLLEALRDINNPYFNAAIFRKEKKDFDNLEKESNHLYSQYGRYNKSQSDMTWYFNRGGTLSFFHFSDTVFDFKERFRGKQYSYIAIDEIPQMEYAKFKFLMTSNRNARGIRNRMVGTCNPDPDSWVRKFIDWWIGEDGLPIDERDGVIRYCFMDGDTPNSIYWGDTPEEVYEQCKSIIDKHWKPEFDELGYDKVTMYIKSVTFIRGKLEENIKLIGSDPNYVSSLVQQDEEQRARDLDGNWNFKNTGDDLIKMSDMERFFNAPAQIEKGIKYVSADIAFEGGDFCVMWLWQDLHIKDVFVMRENSANTETMFVAKLQEWGVREENVIYDYWGVGQALSGHVKRAVKFTGTQKPEKQYEQSYKNIKSQCAEMLAHYIQDEKVSIEPRLLDLKFSGKKGKYQNVPLRDILMKERKCVRHKDNSNIGGFELINKDGMIKAVGYSPDFFESLIYRMYFEINKKKVFRPKGMLRYVSYRP